MSFFNVNNERGSAVILTILISAVMITVGLGFNWIVKEHLKAAEGIKAKAEAMVEARSAYSALVYSILNGRMGQKEIILAGGEGLPGVDSIPLGSSGIQLGSGVHVAVRDSSGLLSVPSMDMEALKRLVRIAGGGEEMTGSVADSYIDWIDSDDFSRLNGAESAYYRGENRPYAPRNFTMQYKDEMSFIRGMDAGLYKNMERYLTILPSFGFNPNTADDEVLMAYLDIDKETLGNLRDYMGKRPITSDTELFALTGRRLSQGEGIYYYPSPYLEITVKAGSPRTLYTLEAGIDIRQKPISPLSVIYWKEG